MATENPQGSGNYFLDQGGETVTLDGARLVISTGTSGDNVTLRNAAGISSVIVGAGSDTVTFESFNSDSPFPAEIATFALFDSGNGDQTLNSDGATDTVTLGNAALTNLDSDDSGRAFLMLGFGTEDRLNLNGISADNVEVILGQEIPSFVPVSSIPGDTGLDSLQTGTSIILDNDVVVQVMNSATAAAFADESDFNDRVTFGGGGTATFRESLDLGSILEDFRNSGVLPTEEEEGVFELPDEPGDDDVVINIPTITIEIDGEEVTFDPEDPFFFDDLSVEAREAFLADPELAVGYDYQITGDTSGQAFATVMAPAVGGDTSYNLVVFDESGETQPARQISADTTIDFESEYDFAVTRFLIQGISPDAELDPEDQQAFPTSLSFVQSGRVDLQQTPLVQDFDNANVFLNAGRGLTLENASRIFGRDGGDERVYIAESASNVRTDANLERLDIAAAFSEVSFRVSDDGLTLNKGGTTLVTVPSLNQAMELRFSDGDATVAQVGAQSFEVTGGDGGSATIDASGGDTAAVTLGGNTAAAPDSGDGSAAARIFLNEDSGFTLSQPAEIFGRSGGEESLTVKAGVTGVRTDSNIESLDFADNLADLAFQVTDSGLALSTGGSTVATIPSLNQEVSVAFGDGNATLRQTGAQSFQLENDSSETADIGTDRGPVDLTLGSGTASLVGVGDTGSGGTDDGGIA
jgi:hypothetical protein